MDCLKIEVSFVEKWGGEGVEKCYDEIRNGWNIYLLILD